MKTTILFAFILVSAFGWSQTQLKGQVISKGNEPIYGARVLISGTYDGANTDPEGRFTISTSKIDSVKVSIKCNGYDPVIVPFFLLQDSNWSFPTWI